MSCEITRPCPWCGTTENLAIELPEDLLESAAYVHCLGCEAHGPLAKETARVVAEEYHAKEATALWNDDAGREERRKQVEKLLIQHVDAHHSLYVHIRMFGGGDQGEREISRCIGSIQAQILELIR